jgi:hypothetical protein
MLFIRSAASLTESSLVVSPETCIRHIYVTKLVDVVSVGDDS